MSKRPHTEIELTPEAARLLAAVNAADGWVDRRTLADGMGKNKLNAGDIAHLDVLAANGLIEKQKRDNSTPIGYEWVYRAKTTPDQ